MLLPAAFVLTMQAAMPGVAEAACGHGCTGSLVGKAANSLKDQLDGSTYYRSDIKLYYDAGRLELRGSRTPGQARYGERTPLWISMYNARWAEDNWKNNYDEDQGRYKYHAWPIKVYGKNMCVSIHAKTATTPDPASPVRATTTAVASATGVGCD